MGTSIVSFVIAQYQSLGRPHLAVPLYRDTNVCVIYVYLPTNGSLVFVRAAVSVLYHSSLSAYTGVSGICITIRITGRWW